MNACRKVRFETRQEAEDALLVAKIRAQLRIGRHCQKRKEVRVYYCGGTCRGFHLTSQPLRSDAA